MPQGKIWYVDKMVQKMGDLNQLNVSAVWDTDELFSSSIKKQNKRFHNNYLKLQ